MNFIIIPFVLIASSLSLSAADQPDKGFYEEPININVNMQNAKISDVIFPLSGIINSNISVDDKIVNLYSEKRISMTGFFSQKKDILDSLSQNISIAINDQRLSASHAITVINGNLNVHIFIVEN